MSAARGAARAAAALLLLAAGAGAHAAPPAGAYAAAPATLEALMAGMAGAKGVRAEFREVKTLALLSRPLESRGVLSFVPPDRMVRRTLEPAPSSLVVDGRRVTFTDASGGAPVDLSADPSAREFVDNFTTIFRGDLESLRRRYEVAFESEPPRWRLLLRPRDALLQRFVDSLTLEGEGEAMRQMTLVERDGDRTETWFERVETDRAFTPEEIRELFGGGGNPAP
jgi:outer membrane lipoprotein-sorting protein